MPLYEFRNKETGEVFERFMSIASREEYLKENQDVEPVLSAPPLMDPVTLGVRRPDQGFKEVLQRIDKLTPGSKLKTNSNI